MPAPFDKSFLDSTFNLRYNPFTDAFTAYGIGKSGNPVENKTIPAVSPYWVYLDEIPQEDGPSTVGIIETAPGVTTFTEVGFATEPGPGQYRVAYNPKGQGIIEFNSVDAGKALDIEYYGLGSILDKQFLTSMFERNLPTFDTVLPSKSTMSINSIGKNFWTTTSPSTIGALYAVLSPYCLIRTIPVVQDADRLLLNGSFIIGNLLYICSNAQRSNTTTLKVEVTIIDNSGTTTPTTTFFTLTEADATAIYCSLAW